MTWLFLALLIALGYAVAVGAATLVFVAVVFAPTFAGFMSGVPVAADALADLPLWLGFGAVVTALYALPGFAVAVVLAERRRERRAWWFSLAGVLTAMVAVLIGSRGSGLLPEFATNAGALLGGALGGLAYWAVAGRRSGASREADP